MKPQAELLKKIQTGEWFANGTGFECPVGTSNNWSENDWTKRLVRGIEKIYPQVKVTFSANMGTTFEAKLLRQLRVHAASEYFFFYSEVPQISLSSLEMLL